MAITHQRYRAMPRDFRGAWNVTLKESSTNLHELSRSLFPPFSVPHGRLVLISGVRQDPSGLLDMQLAESYAAPQRAFFEHQPANLAADYGGVPEAWDAFKHVMQICDHRAANDLALHIPTSFISGRTFIMRGPGESVRCSTYPDGHTAGLVHVDCLSTHGLPVDDLGNLIAQYLHFEGRVIVYGHEDGFLFLNHLHHVLWRRHILSVFLNIERREASQVTSGILMVGVWKSGYDWVSPQPRKRPLNELLNFTPTPVTRQGIEPIWTSPFTSDSSSVR